MVKVCEESQENNSTIGSVWPNIKYQMWILIFFGHDHQVLWKFGMIWCRNWYACHASQTVNFMCWTEVLIKKSQIWCMNAQFEFCMLNHEETCFDPKWSHFHEFLMISEMQSIVGLPTSWKVWWRNVLSLMRCFLSWSEKWWSEWKVKFLKHQSIFLFKSFVWE